MASDCGNWCMLAPDVVASTFAPNEPAPRRLQCERGKHGRNTPCQSEGWAWKDGCIWHLPEPHTRDAELRAAYERGVRDSAEAAMSWAFENVRAEPASEMRDRILALLTPKATP